MIRQSVSSSNLQSVGYDPTTRVLEIAFIGGGIYQYHGVPATTYQSLMSAPSKGSFFARCIRNVFPTTRVG
ncbi:TPA: KTSC domain-containing protein [Citrobacter farmeri]